jgi:hypothetical protein
LSAVKFQGFPLSVKKFVPLLKVFGDFGDWNIDHIR